jgi:hypothetical protein
MAEYTITFTFDEEAAVWYVLNDDIPLALESDSFDVLKKTFRYMWRFASPNKGLRSKTKTGKLYRTPLFTFI